MKKSFSARKGPRVIRDASSGESDEGDYPAVSRSKIRAGGKGKSGVRVARGASKDEVDNDDDDDDDNNNSHKDDRRGGRIGAAEPSSKGRRAKSRAAGKEAAARAPQYSGTAIQELHESSLGVAGAGAGSSTAKPVDVAAKFGVADDGVAAGPGQTYIPTEGEIREKKARRARRAHAARAAAGEYDGDLAELDELEELARADPFGASAGDGFVLITEGDGEDGDGQDGGRLARDEEGEAEEDAEEAEGLDEFVDSSRTVPLGPEQAGAWEARRRREIAARIADAQAEASESEEEQAAAEADLVGHFRRVRRGDGDGGVDRYREATCSGRYEEAQTRAGRFGRGHGLAEATADDRRMGGGDDDGDGAGGGRRAGRFGTGAVTPERVRPVMPVGEAVARLARVRAMLEAERAGRVGELARVEGERARIGEEEAWLQRRLAEVGARVGGREGAGETEGVRETEGAREMEGVDRMDESEESEGSEGSSEQDRPDEQMGDYLEPRAGSSGPEEAAAAAAVPARPGLGFVSGGRMPGTGGHSGAE